MIPHNRPTLGKAERDAAARAIASGWVAGGPEMTAFEDELCAFFGLEPGMAVAVSSGSAALFLALSCLRATTDAAPRRIGMPAYACAALAQAAWLAGDQPVFIDSIEDSPLADPAGLGSDDIDIAIPVATFGMPPRLPPLPASRIVLDLAQAMGMRMGGDRLPASVGCAVLSFSATKLMTTGGTGGAIVSRDAALIGQIRDYIDFDGRHDRKHRFNFRLGDVQAAIGRSQLERYGEFIERRAEIAGIYAQAGLPLVTPGDGAADAVPYRAVVRTSRPDAMIGALADAGYRAIVPIEVGEFLADPADCPAASQFARGTVSLPIYPTLGADHARIIAGIAVRWQ